MKKRRIVALILALAMGILTFAFVGCEPSDPNNPDGPDNPSGPTGDADLATSFNNEKKNFDGMTFNILTRHDREGYECIDVIADDNLGDNAVVSAVRERNDRLQTAFNFKITRTLATTTYNEINMDDIIEKQDETISAFQGMLSETSATALTGALVDFAADGSYVDVDQEYWDTNAVKALAMNKGIYMLTGDSVLYSDAYSWCVLFNKDLYEAETGNKSSVLYSTVLEGDGNKGGWTIEYMYTLASTAYRSDPNATEIKIYDTSYTGTGTYGMVLFDVFSQIVPMSAGVTPVKMLKNGRYTNNYLNKEYSDAVNALHEVFGGGLTVEWRLDPDVYISNGTELAKGVFRDGKALLLNATLRDIATMRSMDDDFGILPVPKLNENQLNYGNSIVVWNCASYSAPTWNYMDEGRDEDTTYILEAMAYYSSPEYFERQGMKDTSLMTSYYETLLERKTTRDDESIGMLRLLRNNYVYDLSVTLGSGVFNDGDVLTPIRYLELAACADGNHTFASDIQKVNDIAKRLQELLDAIN